MELQGGDKKRGSGLLRGAVNILHNPCCSPSTSRAIEKSEDNYILPGLVTPNKPRHSCRGLEGLNPKRPRYTIRAIFEPSRSVPMDNNKLANPAPLGLMGFGMTTVLLNIHNAGFFPRAPWSSPWASSTAASPRSSPDHGIQERQHLRDHGLYLVRAVLADARGDLGHPRAEPAQGGATPVPSWAGTCSCGACSRSSCGSARFGKNRALQFVFLSLTVLFWLLAARDWTGSAIVGTIAGFEGIACGLSRDLPGHGRGHQRGQGPGSPAHRGDQKDLDLVFLKPI